MCRDPTKRCGNTLEIIQILMLPLGGQVSCNVQLPGVRRMKWTLLPTLKKSMVGHHNHYCIYTVNTISVLYVHFDPEGLVIWGEC